MQSFTVQGLFSAMFYFLKTSMIYWVLLFAGFYGYRVLLFVVFSVCWLERFARFYCLYYFITCWVLLFVGFYSLQDSQITGLCVGFYCL